MTNFQNQVFQVVKRIPKGKFLTYKQVVEKAGFPKAWRAAGNVLNKNYDAKIPCHRVVRSDGKIGGYNRGTKKKETLLYQEDMIIKKHGAVL